MSIPNQHPISVSGQVTYLGTPGHGSFQSVLRIEAVNGDSHPIRISEVGVRLPGGHNVVMYSALLFGSTERSQARVIDGGEAAEFLCEIGQAYNVIRESGLLGEVQVQPYVRSGLQLVFGDPIIVQLGAHW